MFFKQNLIDQSVYIKKIPTQFSDIDFTKIRQDALDSYKNKKVLSTNKFSPEINYYKVKDRKDNVWVYEFIRDHFRQSNLQKTENTLIMTESAYVVINKNSDIASHNHINEYDINNSPDYTAIAVIDADKDSFIEINYEGGRKRNMKQRVPLIPMEVIVFNAELEHRYLLNKNLKNTIVLTFKLQLF
jgi:hypothetical protein